jgi:uncharacterized membrane protein (UPF0127 family)
LITKEPNSRTVYCVFNETRESFLSLRVTATDTNWARLKGLIGRAHLKSDEGIWVIPSKGIHTIGVLFPIDLIYLDAQQRVVHTLESFGTFRIRPLHLNCASILELPTRTLYSSQTKVGDQLRICSAEEMEQFLHRNQG